jgi:hypothetical protein
MALRDPVAVYNAANNLEAQLLSNRLNEAGIEAHVTEDVSIVGVWLLGLFTVLPRTPPECFPAAHRVGSCGREQ